MIFLFYSKQNPSFFFVKIKRKSGTNHLSFKEEGVPKRQIVLRALYIHNFVNEVNTCRTR